MTKLTKFDVLRYLTENEYSEKEELVGSIRSNAMFEEVSERVVEERLRDLRRNDLIEDFKPNSSNPDYWDIIGFIYWSNHRNVNWRDLTADNCVKVFESILGNLEVEMSKIERETSLSTPTVSNYLEILEIEGFIEEVKSRPKTVRPLINDKSFFYINLYDFDLESYSDQFSSVKKKEAESLEDKLAKIHVYSTTVTEGNTATKEQVTEVLGNFSTDLTPKEVTEILNSYKAVEKVEELVEKDLELSEIEELHKVLMNNLVDNPGEFEYSRKRIIGSDFNPPSRKLQIDSALKSMINFADKNSELRPEVLGSLIHFIFSSIHPFKDGNGRMARLIHSWILKNRAKPIFAFDPNKRNEYFQKLGEGNQKDLTPFIKFCIEEQNKILEDVQK